jgi:hypothetical protein
MTLRFDSIVRNAAALFAAFAVAATLVSAAVPVTAIV